MCTITVGGGRSKQPVILQDGSLFKGCEVRVFEEGQKQTIEMIIFRVSKYPVPGKLQPSEKPHVSCSHASRGG